MFKTVIIALFIFSIIKIILLVLMTQSMRVRLMTEEEKEAFDKEDDDSFF